MQQKNMKALFRRAQAYISIDEFVKAKADLEVALAIEPDSAEIKNAFAALYQRREQFTEKEKKLYASMFK